MATPTEGKQIVSTAGPADVSASTPAAASAGIGAVIARNSLINLIGLGAPLIAAVVAIPPIVEGLGPERFGLLGLIWVAVAYLNLLDLGLGRATTRFASAVLARGAPGELRGILGVSAVWQAGLGLAGGIVAAALAGPLVHSFLNLSPALEEEALWSFLTLAAAAPAIAMFSSFRGLLEADQRFGLINAIRAPLSAANFLIPLVGTWLDWSLPGIVGWMVVARVTALAAMAIAGFRRWPELRGPIRIERGRLEALLRFGGWVTVSSVIASLLVYLDRFAIGGLVTVEQVGYYTVPHEMVTRLEILPASLVLTLFPALSALADDGAAGDDAADARRSATLVARSVETLLVLIGPIFIGLAVFAHDLLSVWLYPAFADTAASALRVLAIGMLINAMAYVPFAAIQAAGRPDLTARFHMIQLPIYVVLLLVMTTRWGIAGAALAWALRAALDGVLVFGALPRLRGADRARLRTTRVPGVLAALAVFGLVAVAAAGAATDAATGLLLLGSLLALWFIATWRWGLAPVEKARIRGALLPGSERSAT